MGEFILLMISAILVNNILLIRFLGNCPFLGVSKSMDTATGMGMAVIFVLTLAGMITWLVHHYILVPLDLTYLRTIAFILVIATLVQFVEMVIQKTAVSISSINGSPNLRLVTRRSTVRSQSNRGCCPERRTARSASRAASV